jgi:hypothetical protein
MYPFRATNPHDNDSWETIQAIKTRILHIWDGALPPVRICCIKFAQRVVLAQTMSNGGEQKVCHSLSHDAECLLSLGYSIRDSTYHCR